MSHLNIAFDRYVSLGTVMHYILVISEPMLDKILIVVASYKSVAGIY